MKTKNDTLRKYLVALLLFAFAGFHCPSPGEAKETVLKIGNISIRPCQKDAIALRPLSSESSSGLSPITSFFIVNEIALMTMFPSGGAATGPTSCWKLRHMRFHMVFFFFFFSANCSLIIMVKVLHLVKFLINPA